MQNILFVNACVRPESRTLELAQHLLAKLDGQTEELNLQKENIPPLTAEALNTRNALLKAQDFSAPMLRYARQFAQADTVVIAAPYWDLMFPALLKIYFEAITVTGLTFAYSPEGRPIGLCKAKRLFYVTTAGGPILDFNFGFDYTKTLAQVFYGIPEVHCFTAEGLDIHGADIAAIMAQAKADIDKFL